MWLNARTEDRVARRGVEGTHAALIIKKLDTKY